MATRQTAAQKAAQAVEDTKPADPNKLPDAWGDEPIDDFNGHNLTEKTALIGVPFLIIGAEVQRTERTDPLTGETNTYDGVYVYALDVNGTEFEFYDTSDTGVRGQVQGMITEKGGDPAPGAGFQKLRVKIMGGLRPSTFSVRDKETGKKREATTWYLTASGRKIG